MLNQVNADIGIREIRQLTSLIREKYHVDYSEYALTSFKRRIEKVMNSYNWTFDQLLLKLESGSIWDNFISQIAVSVTELFRDPSFWILLKNVYIPKLLKENGKIRIWVPMCASGEELYSLAILLKENNWTQQCEVYFSSISNEHLNLIEQGWMEHSKLEISTKNYSRFQGIAQLSDYYQVKDNNVYFNRLLFPNIHSFKQSFEFKDEQQPMHFILFRNQMIYFNSTLQSKICNILYDKLSAKGLLALGILEEIELNNINNKYVPLHKEESIYQKK